MSAAVGARSATKDLSFNRQVEEEEPMKNKIDKEQDDNDNNIIDGDDPDEEDDSYVKSLKELDLGPQFSLKEQLEKDKNDESLRKWKEQLLGGVDLSAVGESKEPEVKIITLTMVSPERPDLVLPIPSTKDSKSSLFTLKEGSNYRLKFTFNNIVLGLKYTNTVWKTGVRVDHAKRMLGTFSPQQEPYTCEMDEETTPSGILARGSYSARTKFVDDDGKCYLDVSYYFEIQKNWPKHS